VLLAVIPQFEASGRKVKWETARSATLSNRIETGESFDLVIAIAGRAHRARQIRQA